MRTSTALAFLSLLATSERIHAQCAGSDRTDPLYAADKIQLVASGFPSSLSSVVTVGMEKWNSEECNSGGDAFSYFQTTSTGAGRVITVAYRAGMNSNNNYSCGNFSGNLINLYSQARNPASGVIVSCGNSDRMAESLAHELGHLLGLSDQYTTSCQGVIMSQVSMTSTGTVLARGITAAECQRANELNLTSPEQPPPPPPPDDDAYCDAYCWTSCISGQCPSGHPGCPVILDLNRQGIRLTNLEQAVHFDIDADGIPDHMTWTTGGDGDGFLVLDRNGNGLIDDGSELFGNATLLSNGKRAANGYLALADFDRFENGGNGDNQLTANDTIYRDLQIWIDYNHNATSEATELISLWEEGITRISLDYTRSNRSDRYGNELRFRGSAWRIGPAGAEKAFQTWDVFFQIDE